MKIYPIIIIVTLLLLVGVKVSCQNENDLKKVIRETINIDLKEGKSIRGELIDYSETFLLIQQDAQKQKIRKEDILYVWQNSLNYHEPYPNFGGLLHTAFELDEIELRNDIGLLNRFSFPVKGNLSATVGGVFFLGKDDNFYLASVKQTFKFKGVYISPTISYLFFSRGSKLLNPNITLSLGKPRSHLNFGIGYAFDTRSNSSDPFYTSTLGGYYGLTNKVGLNNENIFVLEDDDYFLFTSLQIKINIKSFELGLGAFLGNSFDDSFIFPNFTFTYSKARKRIKNYYNID